jgi:peptidyl-tRNA hydrolase
MEGYKGTSNAFYGYSSTRHAVGKIVKNQLVKKFREIESCFERYPLSYHGVTCK